MDAAKISDGFFARLLRWQRLRVVLVAAAVPTALLAAGWESPYWVLVTRWIYIGMLLLSVFTLFERWPRRLPRWFARWALQVVAVVATIPIATMSAYALTTIGLDPPWYRDSDRLEGFGVFTFFTLLVAPWITVSALIRQIRGEAEKQALAFELERSEYQRKALDARIRLLQAQVEPHFLFNTLANVRELVDSGSPQASAVLGSLIAYLRAAVPRLNDPGTTVRQEVDLVRAYLEVMHMRMPDRLQYELHVQPATLDLRCPSTTLLTLVENAVRHGIDPSEEGGRIDVHVDLNDADCRVRVLDTGVGIAPDGDTLGTGLTNLRERLSLAFAGNARLHLLPVRPHGVCAQAEFPAQRVVS